MPTKIPTEIIHIEWEGPLTVDAAKELTGEGDYGLYQIYGGHPIYGSNALLYIGEARKQQFGARIGQHGWWLEFNQDAQRASVYVGRLADEVTPTDEIWDERIDLAERLLIFACRPAYNSRQRLGALDVRLYDVHVLNWGSFCDLLPEVSGARWSSKYGVMPNYHEFKTTDPRG